MEGETKENDLRPISDRISGTIRRIEDSCWKIQEIAEECMVQSNHKCMLVVGTLKL